MRQGSVRAVLLTLALCASLSALPAMAQAPAPPPLLLLPEPAVKALAALYGPVPEEEVAGFLAVLERIGVVSR